MSEQCKEGVWRDWSSGKCARKAVKDGYCKQHHPDAVKERQEKSSARWEEKFNNSDSAKLRRALDTIEAQKAEIAELVELLKECISRRMDGELEAQVSEAIEKHTATTGNDYE